MELSKIRTIEKTLRNYEAENAPFHYTIEWVSLDSNTMHNWTGSRRVTGADKFVETVDKLVELPTCKSIHIKVYSGKTGNKVILSEDILVKGREFFMPQIQEPKKEKESLQSTIQNQQQSQQPQGNGLEMVATFLGLGDVTSLNGAQMIGSLLNFRDQQIDTKYRVMEMEKELAKLQLEKKQLEEKILQAESNVEQLESENDNLQDKIDELEGEVERLQKYVPENNPLGMSLTAILGSAGERVIKNIVTRNPDNVAKLLGTDTSTLMGIFTETTPEPVKSNVNNSEADFEVVSTEQVSEQRKQELQAIDGMTTWLKSLSVDNLSLIQQLFIMFSQDISLIELVYSWANGKKTKAAEVQLNE